jgi:tRNA nucleotidyltransferase/poly(A) polymerase
MSDYMFMLESHLSAEQNRVVAEVQAVAQATVGLFLTGGAMRDMLGGFAVRDLDFTVEGNALKLAKAVVETTGAQVAATDDHRKSVELVFPGGVTAEIRMARQERYAKPGAKPQISPATIHEDLRGRDFTVDAIALSLNRASRGLLIDPTNGLADLGHKELRAVYNYALYDDPARILRLIRLRVRLGFTVEERTAQQYANVRAEQLENRIPAHRLLEELHHFAGDSNPAEVLRVLEEEKLLHLFSPALAAPKLNLAGLAKLHKSRQLIPFGIPFPLENFGLFLHFLTEKLTPKEKAGLIQATGMQSSEVALWEKLESRSKKLERALGASSLRRPSQVYQLLAEAPGEQILFLLIRSPLRVVQDRIRNYLQKYLPMAQEVTEEEIKAKGGQPGTPKYQKAREELIAARLNARPKRPLPEAPAEPEAPPPADARNPKRLLARQEPTRS